MELHYKKNNLLQEQADVYVVTVFKDKINYRARGPRTVLTRQTVQGRANDGGLRIGEMDRDCLIAHGMSNFIKESMMVRGDQYEMAVCNKTGCVSIYNESKNIFLSPMADGPLKFVSNIDDNMNIVNVSKYGRDFSIVKVPYAFKLLIQELQAMNCQMRIITEDNVEQLTSLTAGDDIKILGFNNLEEVAEKTKDNDIESKRQTFINANHLDMLDKLLEKTPSAQPLSNDNNYFPDESNLYNKPYDDEMNQNLRPFDQEEVIDPRKSQYRFNPGDLVMFEGDPEPRTTYKIIEFDDEEMKYITMAIDGEYSGKYRDSDMDELETPPKSPSYGPKSPDYNPFTPEPVSMSPLSLTPIDDNIPENTGFRDYNTGFRDFGDELEEEDYDSDSKTYEDDRNAPNYLERPPLSNTPSPDLIYERETTDEGENSKGEKILNRISSLDKREVDNKGLERLSSIENDKDEGEDEEDGQRSGNKKKIV